MCNFDMYPRALCRNVLTVNSVSLALLLTDDFSRETSPGGLGSDHERQPELPARFPISLIQLFREVLKRAPDLG